MDLQPKKTETVDDVLQNIDGYIPERPRNVGCKGFKYMTDCGWEYDCGYNTTLDCEECKYGGGRKNPESKKNQI